MTDQQLTERAADIVSLHHEAAHAVAAHDLGIGYRYVTMRPRDEGIAGALRLHHARERWSIEYAAVLLAGPAVEQHMLEKAGAGADEIEEFWEWRQTGPGEDMSVAIFLAEQDASGPEQIQERVRQAMSAALWLVEEREREIRAVAKALRKVRTLSAKAVRGIINAPACKAKT